MKRYIRTSSNYSISVESFIQQIKDIYHKKFYDSKCIAKLQFINNMTITIKPLLCGDVSDVGYGFFGDIADPFDIAVDVEFPNTSRGEITLSTDIDIQYTFKVDIRMFHMETSSFVVDQPIPFPDATSCGMIEEYNRYYGNYESVLALWEQYVDNIYDTLLYLKRTNNLPDKILKIPALKSKVDNM